MPFLGLDVGTGGSRAVIIDEQGRVLASASAEHVPFESVQTGWAEQDPADWWNAAVRATRQALTESRLPVRSIAAVGLSGQMHGAVLLDRQDRLLRRSIIWCDQRSDPQCRALTASIGAERLIALTANPALPGFTLPKMLWVRDHEPEIWKQVAHVLLPKDYVRLRLTGDHATDMADASGTLLLDVRHRRWSDDMVQAAGVNRDWLPTLHEGPDVTGHVSSDAADRIGLAKGTPVVAGGGDQAAGAVGMGIVRAGVVSATIGTSGVVFAATDRPALDPSGRVHTFCHAVPGRWHVMGVTQAAGLSLRWFRDRFGAGPDDGRDPYVRLTDEAAQAPPGSDGVLWAPYLMGERTPHLDANARAALVGLAASHSRAHVVRAILEGVAFSLRDTFTIFHEMHVPVDTIRLGGGGARSPLWRQIQADIYGRPVEILAAEEGAAYGAAILAGVSQRAWPTVDAACDAIVNVVARIAPIPAAVDTLERQYVRYRAMYPALRHISEAYAD